MFVAPRSRRPLTLGLLAFLFFVFVIYQRPSYTPTSFGYRPVYKSPTGPSSFDQDRPSAELAQFWNEVLDAMMQNKPDAPAIKQMKIPEHHWFAPEEIHDGAPFKRYDGLEMSAGDVAALRSAHARYVTAVKQLAPRIPYRKHSRGIIMTAGGSYISNAILSLLMLRRTGSTMPVELFLDSPNAYARELCETTMVELNVECRSMDAVFKTTPQLPELKKFQYKVFAILFASFEDALFLDADAFPIHNPDHLFDVDPYKSKGMVIWPDLWLSSASKHFYDIAGVPVPPVEARRSGESGIMMYNRAMHADSLLLAAYYNFYGPDYYYTLLSQGSHGEGDKETFLHAAMALRNPFYDVKTVVRFAGRHVNGSFESAGMQQADPMEDYTLNGRIPAMKEGGRYPGASPARVLFMHHNVIKLNINKLGESMKSVWRTNEKGKLQPLWGDQKEVTATAGYNVEKAMWEEIIRVNCHHSFLSECNDLRSWYKQVFPDPKDEKKDGKTEEKKDEEKREEEKKEERMEEENKAEEKGEKKERRRRTIRY